MPSVAAMVRCEEVPDLDEYQAALAIRGLTGSSEAKFDVAQKLSNES
jgi:hypothetical protein